MPLTYPNTLEVLRGSDDQLGGPHSQVQLALVLVRVPLGPLDEHRPPFVADHDNRQHKHQTATKARTTLLLCGPRHQNKQSLLVHAAIVSDTTRHPSTHCTRSVMIIVRANPTRFLGFFFTSALALYRVAKKRTPRSFAFTNSAAWQLHARVDVLVKLVSSSSKKTRPARSSADDIRTILRRGVLSSPLLPALMPLPGYLASEQGKHLVPVVHVVEQPKVFQHLHVQRHLESWRPPRKREGGRERKRRMSAEKLAQHHPHHGQERPPYPATAAPWSRVHRKRVRTPAQETCSHKET